MPLILLGLLVVLGIVIYALIRYGQSGEDVTTPVDKLWDVMDSFEEKLKKGASYTVMEDEEEESTESASSESGPDEGHTLFFPADSEIEKRKRNIH